MRPFFIYCLLVFASSTSFAQTKPQTQVLLLTDEEKLELRVIAIAMTKTDTQSKIEFYTCNKNQILNHLDSVDGNPNAYLSKCTQEALVIDTPEELYSFIGKVERFSIDHKGSRFVGNFLNIGLMAILAGDLLWEMGGENVGMISAWSRAVGRVSNIYGKKYISPVVTEFYESRINWFNTFFGFGGGIQRNYTYFKSKEAMTEYGQLMMRSRKIAVWGTVGVVAGVSYGAYRIYKANQERAQNGEAAPELVSVMMSIQDFLNGNAQTRPQNSASVSAMITAFRAMGYPNWGRSSAE